MTLAAAILLLSVSSLTSLGPGVIAQSTRSSAPASPAGSSAQQEQTPSSPTQSGTAQPTTQNSQAPAGKPKSPAGKRSHPKKQAAPSDCDPAPANSTTPSSPPATASPANQDTSTTPKPCPPPKIVVRQGGISEQSIQLAGSSPSDDPSQKRDAANRMLASTEDNLKKISGTQLTTAQQSSASQIRQFVKQSKSALASGDLERAQTLAWKAKLLSDDLVNPGK
jgi:hypothetical protein